MDPHWRVQAGGWASPAENGAEDNKDVMLVNSRRIAVEVWEVDGFNLVNKESYLEQISYMMHL